MRNRTTHGILAAFAAGTVVATAAEGGGAPPYQNDVPAAARPSEMYEAPASDTIAPPVAVTPSGTGLSARTSLGTWRAYNEQTLSRKVEESKTLAPEAFVPVKPLTAPMPPVDLWTKVEVEGLTEEAAERIRTGAGADYTVSRSTKVGISAEHADAPMGLPATAKTTTGNKVGTYVTVQPLPGLSVMSRGQWEVEYVEPAIGAGVAQTGDSEKASVSVAPRVGKKFMLDNGSMVEPFVTLRNELNLGATQEGSSAAFSESAGAGLTIAKPESYSLSVSTDVDNYTTSDESAVNSKMRFNLPLQ